MVNCTLNIFDYGTISSNLLNYSILVLSLFLAFWQNNDKRIYIVVFVSIFIQLLLCSCFVSCIGISIIYCFIFGYLIKHYRDNKKIKESNYLIATTVSLIVLSGIVLLSGGTRINSGNSNLNSKITALSVFLLNHAIFVGVGACFTFIPKIN
jgi:hypothetical protein